MQRQQHFGRQFYLDKKKGYWISTDYPRIRAHVWVYKNHHGAIEKGFHIHHKDGDKSNNDISNLEKLSSFDHLSLHSSKAENRKRSSEWCNNIRHLTKAWHASEEGKEWHRQHALNMGFGRISRVCQCENCSITYTCFKLSNSRFCSNNCKSSWRRKSGVDNIMISCPKCNQNFLKNKYAKTRNCSRKCANSASAD